MGNSLADIILFYGLLLFCLSAHESAHAWTADKFGDNTARLLGRVTLNPIPHMDMLGTVFLPLMGLILPLLTGTSVALFGWGKPVPVNPNHFKDPRRDSLWVAAAGPISNILMAVFFALFFRLLLHLLPSVFTPADLQKGSLWGSLFGFLATLLVMGVQLNLVLAFFNMIPCFPLDGGTVLRGLLPHGMVGAYDQFSRYSVLVLLLLFMSGLLRYVLKPVITVSRLLLPAF